MEFPAEPNDGALQKLCAHKRKSDQYLVKCKCIKYITNQIYMIHAFT